MPAKYNVLKKILIWRYKHISERQFIYVLSVLVGLYGGFRNLYFKRFNLFNRKVVAGKAHQGISVFIVFYFSNHWVVFSVPHQEAGHKKRNRSWNFYHPTCHFKTKRNDRAVQDVCIATYRAFDSRFWRLCGAARASGEYRSCFGIQHCATVSYEC